PTTPCGRGAATTTRSKGSPPWASLNALTRLLRESKRRGSRPSTFTTTPESPPSHPPTANRDEPLRREHALRLEQEWKRSAQTGRRGSFCSSNASLSGGALPRALSNRDRARGGDVE